METLRKGKGRGMVSGQDRSSSGGYPVFEAVTELPGVIQSRVDADEVTGRHADATISVIFQASLLAHTNKLIYLLCLNHEIKCEVIIPLQINTNSLG